MDESVAERFRNMIGWKPKDTSQKTITETPSEPARPRVEEPKKTPEETTKRVETESPGGSGTADLKEGFLERQKLAQKARPAGKAVPAKGSPAEAEQEREKRKREARKREEEREKLTNP